MPPIHVLICTHTPRGLARSLAATIAQQPASIVVSSDAEDEAISDVVREASAHAPMPLGVVTRPHQGQSRSAQVRNNAARMLVSAGLGGPGAVLAFLDGDCCPMPGWRDAIERAMSRADLAIGFRIDLTREQTDAYDDSLVADGSQRLPVEPTADQWVKLRARDRRYRRHALLRRLGLVKGHKPKVLSANFAVTLDLYRRVNGFDEEYLGYGGEDDDLGRRVYAAGGRPAIVVASAIVLHQWHATRAAAKWEDSPGIARFRAGGPTRCKRGLENPYPQPTPRESWMNAKARVEAQPSPAAFTN
ncbi:MAG: galactosyltransferase-related protein [Phycisphaerales bacterium]